MAIAVPPRSEIPKQYTWNAESVYESVDAWEAEFDVLSAEIPHLEGFAGKLSLNAAKLADWLETSNDYWRRLLRLTFYAMMSVQVNTNDETAKTLMAKGQGLSGKAQAATAFAEPEILDIDESVLRDWIGSEPRLKVYEQYLENLLRTKPHIRSAEVEAVMSMVAEPFNMTGQTAGTLSNADLTFKVATARDGEETPVTQSGMPMLMHSPDRALRQTAWERYADGYLGFQNTLANIYVQSVKQNNLRAKVRGYETALEASLDRHNLSTDVFHNLIETYRANLPTWHRYWDVRRRALKLNQIKPFDLWAPLTPREPKITFEESVEWIATGMGPLGSEYVNILRAGCLENRWVDAMPNQGKRQGAFSYGAYDTHPFIMMSYDGGLGGLSTLAHELGHSMHSYLSRSNQPFVYSNYSMFVAEVASNFNQALVRAYLFEKHGDDRDFQLALIQEAMSNFHRYFFIMPTLARFEWEIHSRVQRGEPVTATVLNTVMGDFFAEGYGDTLTDDPKRTGITWAQFGHLYVPFYTFQYATGISAAHALADGILSGDTDAVDRYLHMLKAGSSVYPMDALKQAGVDMSTPEPVEKAFAVMKGLVDRLESLVE